MINDSYLYSTEYSDINSFSPQAGSSYFYCYSTENRSHFVDEIKKTFSENVTFIEIIESGKDKILNA